MTPLSGIRAEQRTSPPAAGTFCSGKNSRSPNFTPRKALTRISRDPGGLTFDDGSISVWEVDAGFEYGAIGEHDPLYLCRRFPRDSSTVQMVNMIHSLIRVLIGVERDFTVGAVEWVVQIVEYVLPESSEDEDSRSACQYLRIVERIPKGPLLLV